MTHSKSRRDILLLMGLCLLGLAPVAYIARLRSIPEPPKPVPKLPTASTGPIAVPGPLRFSPDGRLLAGVLPALQQTSYNKQTATMVIWRVTDGKELRRWKINGESYGDLRWRADGRVIQNSSRWVERWTMPQGKRASRALLLDFYASSNGELKDNDLVFSHSAASFLTDAQARVDSSMNLELYSTKTGRRLSKITKLPNTGFHSSTFHYAPTAPLRFALGLGKSDGDLDHSFIQMWDVKTKRRLWQTEVPAFTPSGDFSSDGRFYVVWNLTKKSASPLTSNTIAWVLNAATGKKLHEFETNDSSTESAATGQGNLFVSGGRDLLPGSQKQTAAVRIHRLDTGKLVSKFQLPKKYNSVSHIAISPDGKQLVTSNYQGLYLWSMADLLQKQDATPQLIAPPVKGGPNFKAITPAMPKIIGKKQPEKKKK